jgi:hypothetical protein
MASFCEERSAINVGEKDKTTGPFTTEPRTSVDVEVKGVRVFSERYDQAQGR